MFSARLSDDFKGNFKIIPFDELIARQGNNYNATTGVYTANESGFYFFSLTIMSYQEHYCGTWLTKNGKNILFAIADARTLNGTNEQMASTMTVLQLNQTDKVWVESGTCEFAAAGYYSTFTGWKIA